MKKNTMMRAASALLVAVLLTTCTISGTFAKYTTQDSGSDTARVAKWGVELQVIGNLYGETYLNAIVADNADTDGEDTTNLSVQAYDYATTDDDVVAPGTLNENGLSISLNGTPEVDGQVVTTIEYENIYLTKGSYGVMAAVASDVVTKENFATHGTLYTYDSTTKKYSVAATYTDTTYYTLEDNVTLTEDYYPVEYKMTGTLTNYNTSYDAALSTDTLAKVIENFTSGLGTKGSPSVDAGKTTCTWTKDFTANTDLNTALKIGGQNIFWKWDFENNTSPCSGDNSCNFCKADTILGDLAAGSDATAVVKLVDNSTDPAYYAAPTPATGAAANDYNLETGLSINITVTQVD